MSEGGGAAAFWGNLNERPRRRLPRGRGGEQPPRGLQSVGPLGPAAAEPLGPANGRNYGRHEERDYENGDSNEN